MLRTLRIIKCCLPPLLLASLPAYCQTNDKPLPNSALKKTGYAVLTLKTLPNSFQIYTCGKTKDGGFGWSNDPDAVMTDGKATTVHHYHGPTWEMPDGSIVHSDGTKAMHFLPLNPNSVHWLELPGLDGKGQFAKLTLIQRVDTTGGTGPAASECSAANAGEQRRSAYSPTYRFIAR